MGEGDGGQRIAGMLELGAACPGRWMLPEARVRCRWKDQGVRTWRMA